MKPEYEVIINKDCGIMCNVCMHAKRQSSRRPTYQLGLVKSCKIDGPYFNKEEKLCSCFCEAFS